MVKKSEALEQSDERPVCFLLSDLGLPVRAAQNEQGLDSVCIVYSAFQVPNRILIKWKFCPPGVFYTR